MKNKFGYGVEIHQTCVHRERSPEQYGEWSESYDNRLGDIARKNVKHPDVVSDFDIPVCEDAWVVWVEWSSGDSFGWADNAYTDVIGIFRKQDYDSAESLKHQIENHGDGSNYDYTYKFETPDGQKFEGYASWIGYFERLSGVHIEKVVVVE